MWECAQGGPEQAFRRQYSPRVDWACVIVGTLLLARVIEINGARSGFLGANGIFLFISGYLTVLSSPVLLIIT